MSSIFSSSSSKKSSKSGKSGSSSGSKSNPASESKAGPKPGSRPSAKGDATEAWCEWEWDAQWEREWRSRKRPNGEWEYQYRYLDNDTTPRSSVIGSGDNLGPIEEEAGAESAFTLSRPASDRVQIPTSSPARVPYSSAVDRDSGYGLNTGSGQIHLSRNLGNLQIAPGLQQDGRSSYGTIQPSMVDGSGFPIQSANQEQITPEDDYYNDEEALPPSPSKQFTYSMPSKTTMPSFPSPYSASEPPNLGYSAYSSTTTAEPPMAVPPPERALTIDSEQHITAGPTVAEDLVSPKEAALHGNFKVHDAKHFELNKVFKILWTEPRGQGMATKRTEVVPTILGQDSYTSIRRFVIFNHLQGHCLCLPILTYKGQGTAKSGAKAQDHAIIYTEGRRGEKPRETEDEEKLLKKAIRMEPKTQRDQLDPLSRLNYAKIYTVEYNVKVSFIGRIHKDSIKYFNRDFNLTHRPLPEAENFEYSDDNQDLQQLGERDAEPQNRHERRVPEPSSRHRGSHREQQREQQNRDQRGRGKKGK